MTKLLFYLKETFLNKQTNGYVQNKNVRRRKVNVDVENLSLQINRIATLDCSVKLVMSSSVGYGGSAYLYVDDKHMIFIRVDTAVDFFFDLSVY